MGEGFWILIAIVLFLIFGKNLNLSSFNTTPNVNVPPGTFDQPNNVPTPDGIGALTTQNQTSPPENQPAPWKSICSSGPVGANMPTLGSVSYKATGSVGPTNKLVLSSFAQN